MKENTNISLIIPIHHLLEGTPSLFSKAIESVKQLKVLPDEILIVRSNDEKLTEYLNNFDFADIKKLVKVIGNTTDDTSFQGQINFGVSQTTSDYFTFLEYDDEISSSWIKNGIEYIKHYPEVGVYLPIIYESNTEGQFLSFTNESVWAKEFSEEQGFIDNNTLVNFPNFNFDGMIVKKSVTDDFGCLKSNIKLTFTYEFLLRMTYNSVPVMVIPKLGIKHTNNRDGSLFVEYKNTMNPLESRFWQNQAKKEYYWAEDREITYEREEV